MQHLELTLRVRQLVHKKFRELGIQNEVAAQESMLIRDGFFCGRRFRCEELEAVWFFEDNQVKFYDRDGYVLEACSTVAQRQLTTKLAA